MAIVRARYAGRAHDKKLPAAAHLSAPIPKVVLIEIGIPMQPTPDWKCGTDLLWPVLRIIEPPVHFVGCNAMVCRHEIEAGD
jgi:hypothetical protein